jgi:hypothetical protein
MVDESLLLQLAHDEDVEGILRLVTLDEIADAWSAYHELPDAERGG